MEYLEKIKYVEKIFGDKINKENILYYHRFWKKVDIKENIEKCWDWTSYIHPSGYGGYWTSITDSYQAHRMAYMLSKGSIPEGSQVQHLCNNPICCNPNHLELGDHSKNMQYRARCRRYNNKGEDNPNSRLTDDQVREIHKLYKEQRKLQPEYMQWQITGPIAKKFGISQQYVNNILAGRVWNHIYEERLLSERSQYTRIHQKEIDGMKNIEFMAKKNLKN